MIDGGNTPPGLKQALEQESARFEQIYLWLKSSMSEVFFKEVSEMRILLIVHSLMGFEVQDYFSEIHLKNSAMALCVDNPEADISILKNYPMYGIKNYTSYISKNPLPFGKGTNKLRIGILYFTEAIEHKSDHKIEPLNDQHVEELISTLVARDPSKERQQCLELIKQCDIPFLRKMPNERQVIALEMLARAFTRDHCQYEVQYQEDWEDTGSPSMHIVMAWKNVPKHNFLYRLARVVSHHKLVMHRVNAAYVNPYKTDSIFLLSFGLHGVKNEAAWEAADMADFLQEIVTLKYFGSADRIDETFVVPTLIRGNLGNLLRSILPFIHQTLVNVDPNLYNHSNIEEGICRHPELTIKLLEAFEHKFHPTRHDFTLYEEAKEAFLDLVSKLDTGHEFHDNRRKNILLQAMNFVQNTLKTNFYRNNKTSFAFRLDPRYLDNAPFDRKTIFHELPFAIFYLKGMHYFGFHIRFKDLSRGGLRTIYPEKKEHMLAERNTIFSECYNLAYTQNKKNKDIPEGGAKCVIFLKPNERLESEAKILQFELESAGVDEDEIHENIELYNKEQKLEYLYQTQRSFIKNLLSLINCNCDGSLYAKHIVDYWQKPEYLYLGPDENMHNSMIEWIAHESKKDHYRPGEAFISGKPTLGINHKEYGVTSLGVQVYVEEILKFLEINPKIDPFTIKISGGPDGDVAGNLIHNLYTHYPTTAKLVALTDISGTINDPHGLDLAELDKLFLEGKSIRHYPHKRLSTGGFLLDRETKREPSPYTQQTLCWKNRDGTVIADWLSGNSMNALFRNNVHQTTADIFVPCGGRPRTLRESNYTDFLTPDGTPTSKAIVEGANLYLSQEARLQLEKRGALIIKDSSANKGGVICSSFEILCVLTLKEEEFLLHKKTIVTQVLKRLKEFAFNEARLLLDTHQKTQLPLTDLSEQISKRINLFTDQLLDYFEKIEISSNPDNPLTKCFLQYCPKFLREHHQAELLEHIPSNHKKAIIAAHIASRLVYHRGLDWFPTLVDILPLVLEDSDTLYTN